MPNLLFPTAEEVARALAELTVTPTDKERAHIVAAYIAHLRASIDDASHERAKLRERVFAKLRVAINAKLEDLLRTEHNESVHEFARRWPRIPLARAIYAGAWALGTREVLELVERALVDGG